MFLLVCSRHVGAHLDGHQHGVSIQTSLNLSKNVSAYLLEENLLWLNLGESICIFTLFLFQDSRLSLLNGFDLYFGLF